MNNDLSNDSQCSSPSAVRKRTVADFKFGHLLGEGSYSSVVQAEEISCGKKFAVKVLSKKFIIKENKAKYVTIEKQALTKLVRHPFIVKLHYTFQDPIRLYFVVDLVPNGELLYYLQQKGTFDLRTSQFYLAEIVSAVEYMHQKGVAHRDLKPENILLSENFHIKITDFGSAKLFNESSNSIKDSERTSSFVGTAEYASPELLEDKDASKGADYWALGCILYQMLAGTTPFKASNDYQIFQKIIALNYNVPEDVSSSGSDLIKKLLVRNPSERLGYQNPLDLKGHIFFQDINWEELYKTTPPSFNVPPPDILNHHDLFHLDDSHVPLI